MSSMFSFKAHPEQKEEDILKRIAQIVAGTETYFERQGWEQWDLGGYEEWWMRRDEKTGDLILGCRSGGYEVEKKMQALRTVILWRLGLERLNE